MASELTFLQVTYAGRTKETLALVKAFCAETAMLAVYVVSWFGLGGIGPVLPNGDVLYCVLVTTLALPCTAHVFEKVATMSLASLVEPDPVRTAFNTGELFPFATIGTITWRVP